MSLSGIQSIGKLHISTGFTQSLISLFLSYNKYKKNHIVVRNGEVLLLLHRRHFWIIVKAASSECKKKKTASSHHFLHQYQLCKHSILEAFGAV